METVSFRQMKDGTRADYELLERHEQQCVDGLPDRILEALRGIGEDPDERERYRGRRWFDACERFRERRDQAAFDPDCPTRPLGHFEPLVRRILAREPFDPAVIRPQDGTAAAQGG